MSNIPNLSNTTYVSPLAGSTGPKLHKNATGKRWVVKKGASFAPLEQILGETLANEVYATVGIPVPRHKFDRHGDVLILEYIEGKLLRDAGRAEYAKAKSELQAGFVVDALLANWDVIGLSEDNIILPADGGPAVRIDNGGVFTSKASGGDKPFTPEVKELYTMRDSDVSPSAAKIFGDLTDVAIIAQIERIIIPHYDAILAIFDNRPNLQPTVNRRLDYLVQYAVWGAVSFVPPTMSGTPMPAYMKAVETAIVTTIRALGTTQLNTPSNNINTLNTSPTADKTLLRSLIRTLDRYMAVVSGDFIVKAASALQASEHTEVNIYVPTDYCADMQREIESLVDMATVTKTVEPASSDPHYYAIRKLVSTIQYKHSADDNIKLNILEIVSGYNAVDAVNYEPLSILQNWYNGHTLYMNYPTHITEKRASVDHHYLLALFTHNATLKAVIHKYMKRGFAVHVRNPLTNSDQLIPLNINAVFNSKISVPKATVEVHVPPMNLTTISNTIVELPGDYLNMFAKPFNANTAVNTAPNALKAPLNTTHLTQFEIAALRAYTGTTYKTVNAFLQSPNPKFKQLDPSRVYTYLKEKWPQQADERTANYNNRLIYYYFVNLYNALRKGPKVVNNPFKVYRGTTSWYLKQNTERYYSLNSFASTSLSDEIAKGHFGLVENNDEYENNENTLKYYVYVFYVHPLCKYMNISSISYHNEQEILIPPYQRYYYVRERVDGNTTYRTYVLLPMDLNVPKTYDAFMEWKKHAGVLSSRRLGGKRTRRVGRGGRLVMSDLPARPEFSVMKNLKRGNTRRNSTRTPAPVSPMETKPVPAPAPEANPMSEATVSSTGRFTDPLSSFEGKAPTSAELDVIQKMIAYFKDDPI